MVPFMKNPSPAFTSPSAWRRIAAVSLLFAATSAFSQIYTWKDESGRTVMSDKPPVGKVTQKRTIATPSPGVESNTPAPKSFAEKEMEFRKEQQDKQEKAKKANEDQAQAAARKENCENAKRNLQLFQSGERIARRNDQGEKEFLEDDQRAVETAKAQKMVNDWCK